MLHSGFLSELHNTNIRGESYRTPRALLRQQEEFLEKNKNRSEIKKSKLYNY